MTRDVVGKGLVPPDAGLQPIEFGQHGTARLAGFLYLLQMATAILGFYLHGRLVVPGDAEQTAAKILASERLFRIGTASDLVTTVAVVTLAWALYVVLRTVNKDVALLAAFFRVVESSIAAAALFTDSMALRLLRGSSYLQAFETQQAQALARVFVGGQPAGLQVSFVFVGLGTTLFSYLWYRSRYIPRALAAWGVFSSLLLALGTLAIMVFPGLGIMGLTYMMPMGLYEVGLGLWLLFKGIQAPIAERRPADGPRS